MTPRDNGNGDDPSLREKMANLSGMLSEFRARFAETEKTVHELTRSSAISETKIKAINASLAVMQHDAENLWETFRQCQQGEANARLDAQKEKLADHKASEIRWFDIRWKTLATVIAVAGITLTAIIAIIGALVWVVKMLYKTGGAG